KTPEIPLLPEGNPHPSPLIPPQPQLHESARKHVENKTEQKRHAHPQPLPSTQPEMDTGEVTNSIELNKLMD
ncbi:MAG TPA: hypothetical protein VKU38_19020, partial [Ktedonobacteraceae bacterium]|nr:hypothetical protein [Ktedonobacteraceae bacterium]